MNSRNLFGWAQKPNHLEHDEAISFVPPSDDLGVRGVLQHPVDMFSVSLEGFLGNQCASYLYSFRT